MATIVFAQFPESSRNAASQLHLISLVSACRFDSCTPKLPCNQVIPVSQHVPYLSIVNLAFRQTPRVRQCIRISARGVSRQNNRGRFRIELYDASGKSQGRDREPLEVRQLRHFRQQVLPVPGSTKRRFNRFDPHHDPVSGKLKIAKSPRF